MKQYFGFLDPAFTPAVLDGDGKMVAFGGDDAVALAGAAAVAGGGCSRWGSRTAAGDEAQ